MSQTPRRPVRPARTPTSRPRRIAGQGRDVADVADVAGAEAQPDAEVAPPAEPTVVVPVAEERVDLTKHAEPEPVPDPAGSEPPSRRRVVGLVVAIVVLLAVGIGELVYLASDDAPDTGPISADRPVQVPDLEVRRVVDQAATAADLILSASSTDYDAQVEEATATMTDAFAEQYRTTKADIEERFVAQQTEVVVDISAQGVVSASEDEIVALVFLTQTTQKGTRGGVTPVQYRVTVTMVDTADGWLVSDLVAL